MIFDNYSLSKKKNYNYPFYSGLLQVILFLKIMDQYEMIVNIFLHLLRLFNFLLIMLTGKYIVIIYVCVGGIYTSTCI